MNLRNQLYGTNIFRIIRDLVEIHDIKTYVIGGYVRDLIIGRNSKDIDIVCLGVNSFGSIVKEYWRKGILAIYKQFGTACVKYQKLEIELLGLEKNPIDMNLEKPIVEEGTLEDDQNRRDFTINV